ncbi:MAG: amidohydrolase family protein, partial [Candidatus Rokuibacteriota bacterium]
MRLLIRGGQLITLDSTRRIVAADLAVVGDRIAGVGPAATLIAEHGPPADVLDATDRFVVPGFVNAHTHLFQAAFRGLGDGLSITEWQRRVTHPAYVHLSAEDAYWFTLVGCVENLRSGVTTVVNFQAFPNDFVACRLTAQAIGEAGLRGLLVKCFYGENARPELMTGWDAVKADTERVFAELHGGWEGRVRFCVGPPGARNAPAAWLRETHAIAARHGAGLHVHVAENAEGAADAAARLGKPELVYLDALGVVDERFQAAHCVAVTEEEVRILAARGGHAVHCPVSNMYLANGVADVPGFQAVGVNVALGTDGAATNNNQDMFTVMKVAPLLQKVVHRDPTLLPPGRVLEMATRDGARAAYVEAGVIEPGRLADLVIVDLGGAHNQPLHRPVSALVYSALASDVEAVIVGGRLVMRGRRLLTVDQAAIVAEARRRARA